MRLIILILIFVIMGSATALSFYPSFDHCEFYQSLESKMQCGAHSYVTKWADPLCRKYLEMEPRMSQKVQAFFPEVRFCLQNYLHEAQSLLTCENLNQMALDSHVECYVETGYCELSKQDKETLTKVTGSTLLHPLWFETGLKIAWQCYLRNHQL